MFEKSTLYFIKKAEAELQIDRTERIQKKAEAKLQVNKQKKLQDPR